MEEEKTAMLVPKLSNATIARLLALAATTAAALAVVAATPRFAAADSTTYSSNKRVFKVGVLLIDSTGYDYSVAPPTPLPGGPENPDPHLFYIADSRTDVKPSNWEFVNPLAAKTVTTDIYNRWSRPGTGRDAGHPYRIGQQVVKNMACYWEVPLSGTSINDLLQYDLLFITNHRTVYLSPPDREKLRKLVDAGGVVWMEDCSRMRLHPRGPFFLEQVQFTSGGANGVPEIYIPTHPLLTSPYALSRSEIANLGDVNLGNGRAIASIAPNATLPSDAPLLARPNPQVLSNIVGNSAVRAASGEALPYIAAGQYGSGAVLLTAGDSGCDINDNVGGVSAGYGGNSGAYSGENFLAARTEDLKFLYNAVAWGSSNNAYRRNNRRTAAAFENVGAPLLDGFAARNSVADPTIVSGAAPLLVQGMMVVSGTDGTGPSLQAYSANPSLTIGDLGIPDLGFGKPWDMIWRTNLGGGSAPSTPVYGAVYTGGVAPLDAIFVTLSDGTLVRATLQPTDASGNFLPSPNIASNAPLAIGSPTAYAKTAGQIPPAPVFFENRVYVVEPDGLIRCVDAQTMTTLWWTFASAQSPTITPTGTPSVGVSRLAVSATTAGFGGDANFAARSNGSTNDVMLYCPMVDEDGNASVQSYFLGTRHEVVKADDAGAGNYRTRVAVDASAPANNRSYVILGDARFVAPVVRVYDTVDAMNAGIVSSTYRGTFRNDGSGIVEVRDNSNNPPVVSPRPVISVDYDVRYVTAAQTPPGLGGGTAARQSQPLGIPRWTGPTALTGGLDTVALSPNDILMHVVRQNNDRNGLDYTWILGVNEQYGIGTTKFRQAMGFLEATAPVTVPVGNTQVQELPTLRNQLIFGGPLTVNLSANLATGWEGLTGVVPVGSPIVTNDGVTYVLARAVSAANGGVVTVLMALKTDPEIVLTLPEAFSFSAPVTVQQFNLMTYPPSGTDQVQTLTAVLPANGSDAPNNALQLSGDSKRGRIIVTDLRHPSGARFSTALSFVVTYTPSGGQAPVTVTISPTPSTPITSDSGVGDVQAGNVSPRTFGGGYNPLLWYYVLPGAPSGGATLAGNAIYLVVNNNIVAVDANPAENDPGVRVGFGEQVRAVVANLTSMASGQAVPLATNHVRWVRALGGGAIAPPVVGQGVVAVTTDTGPVAFQNAVTLVADRKRIIEVGADGAAQWTLDSSLNAAIVGGELPIFDPAVPGGILNPPATGRTAADRRPLSQPSVARKLSASDYLIADTGNNRLVRTDRGGRVRWELNRVNDPFGILASGDTLTLDGPTDVQLYLQPTPDPSNPALAPIGYEAHYLIADAGNFRVLEVVDYFDTAGALRTINGQRGEHIVVWVSRTKSSDGRNLRYQSVQRILGAENGVFGIPTLVAVVGNTSAAGSDGVGADFTGGSLVRLDYRPHNTYFVLRNAAGNVLPPAPWPATGTPTGSGFPWPNIGTPAVGNEPTGNGLVASTLNEMIMPSGEVRRVTRPTYFQQLTLPNGSGGLKSVFLICDANGVYQVEPDTMGRRIVTWYFDQGHYDRMNINPLYSDTGVESRLALVAGFSPLSLPRFAPTSVKRLFNGHYLITNSAAGPSKHFNSGQFVGEVFEVEPIFGPGAIPDGGRFAGFAAPSIHPIRNLANPARSTNEQRMGQSQSNTNLLEQPRSGDRL